MAGIYIHFPFCKKACHYCNFHFSTTRLRMPEMIQAINKEAQIRRGYLNEQVDTLYFGGGTPSLLSKLELSGMIDKLKSLFDINVHAEVSLEANPDDINEENLAAWQDMGINRLSIGIQSFFEEDLRWMNRAHSASQARDCIKLSKEYGFHNITIDLIYGTPDLTDEKWDENIKAALLLQIPHLSCYALTVEPNTALAKMIDTHQSKEVDADKQARHFTILTERLADAGFEHYEISNFALPGFRSKHNSSYWQGKPYLGLGPSAHSFNGKCRQWNVANNSLYLTALEKDEIPYEEELLTATQQLNEYIMTSLRTMEGSSLTKIKNEWGEEKYVMLLEASQKHVLRGHMILADDIIKLTSAGKFLADGIASDLFQL